MTKAKQSNIQISLLIFQTSCWRKRDLERGIWDIMNKGGKFVKTVVLRRLGVLEDD